MHKTSPRTRPILSPTQPNENPPMAAPSKKHAMILLSQTATCASSLTASKSCKAGRATKGNSPISTPSNIHARNAAASVNHCPDVNLLFSLMIGSQGQYPPRTPAPRDFRRQNPESISDRHAPGNRPSDSPGGTSWRTANGWAALTLGIDDHNDS